MTYKNAPIREAIFDIQVSLIDGITEEQIESLHSLFIKKYNKKRKTIQHEQQIEIRDSIGTSNKIKSEFRGFIFSNNENNRQVQFRVDGFTLNFLHPYSNWNEFFTEASFLWDIYKKNLKPIKIERIALRYINRIDIPLPINNFQEYIVNMPPIPKSLPQYYSGFFMQIEVPCENKDFSAIITETIETPTKTNVSFILDIDVYKKVIDNKYHIDEFQYIREIKNLIFEDFITSKTRKLFN